jgi:2-polyprenyl-6-methoxyphenol hydroxylase-like FAD-dependent oxidoreductase
LFRRQQCRAEAYEIAGRQGSVIRSLDFSRLMARYGRTYLTPRPTLIRLLRAAAGERMDLRMGTTVTALRRAGSQVGAAMSDGSVARFDLVAGCDGIGSPTRGTKQAMDSSVAAVGACHQAPFPPAGITQALPFSWRRGGRPLAARPE